MITYLLRGIAIGLLFGLPAGAVGALTAQRTLNYGVKAGLLTGLGSSVADCFYACVGAFGLTLISDFLLEHQFVIRMVGAALIFLMGVGMLLKKNLPAQNEDKAASISMGSVQTFLSSFAIGITNPAAILTFLFAFSWFGITGQTAIHEGIALVLGVFVGTYIWWGSLTGVVAWLKKKAKHIRFDLMNKIFGCLMIILAIAVLFVK